MSYCDVIATVHDGAIYCPDCADTDPGPDEGGVVFAGEDGEIIGATCGGCGACYCALEVGRAAEWTTDEDRDGRVRWSRCGRCNGQRPHPATDSAARLDARLGVLRCESCGAAAVRF